MIYVHVPFCESFCVYCGFYSEAACGEKEYGRYLELLLGEIADRRAEIESTLSENTLYIGGGTPSVLPLSYLKRIVDALPYGPYEEFTVEVNPEDIVLKGPEYVRGLKELGVNRVSMGVQSLDDDVLRWMGRRHDADGARKAFGMLREAGIDNVSVDLICGISGFPEAAFERSLAEVAGWRPEHISIYQLSVEPGSALASRAADGKYCEADDELFRKQYLAACGALRVAGYEHYEVSNWALPGKYAVHNSAYWRRCPYVGLGPAAHSLVRKDGAEHRTWNSENAAGWSASGETLGATEIREERIMLGLRTAEGWAGIRLSEEEWLVSDAIISDIAGAEPRIMGILNLTPNSYFESSRCEASDARSRIMAMIAAGADIIDIGAVSTRPGAPDVPLETEWERLEPVLRDISAMDLREAAVSIDTFRSEIVRRAYGILGHAFIVNDISAGEDDPEMLPTVGALGLKYIAMHKRGNPRTMDAMAEYPDGVMAELVRYFGEFELRAAAAGITDWILDPGLGFAKTDAQNWEILERLSEIKRFGRPILVSAADKRFTRAVPQGLGGAEPRGLGGAETQGLGGGVLQGLWGAETQELGGGVPQGLWGGSAPVPAEAQELGGGVAGDSVATGVSRCSAAGESAGVAGAAGEVGCSTAGEIAMVAGAAVEVGGSTAGEIAMVAGAAVEVGGSTAGESGAAPYDGTAGECGAAPSDGADSGNSIAHRLALRGGASILRLHF